MHSAFGRQPLPFYNKKKNNLIFFKNLFTNPKKCAIICLYDVSSVVGYEAVPDGSSPTAC